MDSDWIWIL